MILEPGCTLYDHTHEYRPVIHVCTLEQLDIAELHASITFPGELEALNVARHKAEQLRTNLPALQRTLHQGDAHYQGWDIFRPPVIR